MKVKVGVDVKSEDKDRLAMIQNTIHCRLDELDLLGEANAKISPEVEQSFLNGVLHLIVEAYGELDSYDDSDESESEFNAEEPEQEFIN